MDQIISILLGHANITDDHIRLKFLDQGQGFGSGGGDGDLGLAIGEGASEELAGVGLVIDDEYLEASEGTILAHIVDRTALLGAHLHAIRLVGMDDSDGQHERESRSLALAGALGPDAAAVHLDEMLGDGQP